MAGSPGARLDSGAAGEWLARAFAGASAVAGPLPPGAGQPRGRTLSGLSRCGLRALVQQVPPYRALRGLQTTTSDGWADSMALRRSVERGSGVTPSPYDISSDMAYLSFSLWGWGNRYSRFWPG